MHTPIHWANPHNLELIKQKKDAERLDTSQTMPYLNETKRSRTRWIDILNRALGSRLKPNFEL